MKARVREFRHGTEFGGCLTQRPVRSVVTSRSVLLSEKTAVMWSAVVIQTGGERALHNLQIDCECLVFRRVMGVRTCESRCLFSGSKGEVCCIEPLHSKPELKDHPITQFSLLAMASLTKVGILRRQSSKLLETLNTV